MRPYLHALLAGESQGETNDFQLEATERNTQERVHEGEAFVLELERA